MGKFYSSWVDCYILVCVEGKGVIEQEVRVWKWRTGEFCCGHLLGGVSEGNEVSELLIDRPNHMTQSHYITYLYGNESHKIGKTYGGLEGETEVKVKWWREVLVYQLSTVCVCWVTPIENNRASVKWWIGSRRYSLHALPSFSFLCGMDLCFQETFNNICWVIVSYPIILILCYIRMFDNVGRSGGYWFLCSMTGRNYIRRWCVVLYSLKEAVVSILSDKFFFRYQIYHQIWLSAYTGLNFLNTHTLHPCCTHNQNAVFALHTYHSDSSDNWKGEHDLQHSVWIQYIHLP